MLYTLEALGTKLVIDTLDETLKEELVHFCFCEVKKFEQKFSRFDEKSYLSKINRNWWWEIDDEFLSLLELSQHVHKNSFWYFDITLWSSLEKLWYWSSKQGNEKSSMDDIILSLNTLTLLNGTHIDFWWIWKWYIIDILFKYLDMNISQFIINFWWDIRVKWKHRLGLEDPLDSSKIIWEVFLEDMAICGSSGQKRKFWWNHHLINPKTRQSQNESLAVFTQHRLASFADTYATAIFVSPLETSLKILEHTEWLDGLIITRSWEIYQSNNFLCTLF
jgi:thiamine biosynthesis lipoprotein ApbE